MSVRKSAAEARKSFAGLLQRESRRTTATDPKCKEFSEADFEPLDRLASHSQKKGKKRFGAAAEGYMNKNVPNAVFMCI